MARKSSTRIVSVFGQINGVVADGMAAEGLCLKIGPDMIPTSVRFDKNGQEAHCALVLTPETEAIFDRRVREMRF